MVCKKNGCKSFFRLFLILLLLTGITNASLLEVMALNTYFEAKTENTEIFASYFANDDSNQTEEGIYNPTAGIYYEYGSSVVANDDEYVVLRDWTNGVVVNMNFKGVSTSSYIEATATLYKKSTNTAISGTTVVGQFPTNKSSATAYTELPKGGGSSVSMEAYFYWPASVFNTAEITEGLEDIEVRTTVKEYGDISKSTLIDSYTTNKTNGDIVSNLPVGSSIYMNVDGERTEFIVVHQGNPSTSIYDSSCNGTWVLAKNCVTAMAWQSATDDYPDGRNDYASSEVKAYLDNFVTRLDSVAQSAVKTIKIPYVSGVGTNYTIKTLSNGISATAFLLGFEEVGFTSQYVSGTGAKLDYFNETFARDPDDSRIACYKGLTANWWTRWGNNNVDYSVWAVQLNGAGVDAYSTINYGVRPAFVLNFDTKVSATFDICSDYEEDGFKVDRFDPNITVTNAIQNTWIESANITITADDRVTGNTYSPSGTGSGIKEVYIKSTDETTGTIIDERLWKYHNINTISHWNVGSSIYLEIDGVKTEFIIVHQGNPDSSIYDASCDGTWILAKDCVEEIVWDADSSNIYTNSDIKAYLDNYITKLNPAAQNAVKTVKLPYTNGTGDSGTLETLDSGISATAFLLSATEIIGTGTNSSRANEEGSILSFFSHTYTNENRIAYYNGSAVRWWTRSPSTYDSSNINRVTNDGSILPAGSSGSNTYLRPAFILSSDTYVSEDGEVVEEKYNPSFTKDITIEAPENSYLDNVSIYIKVIDSVGNTSEKTIDNIKIDNAEVSITTDIEPSDQWFDKVTAPAPIVTITKPGGATFTTIKVAETTSAAAPSSSSNEWKTYSPNELKFTYNTTEIEVTTGLNYIHLIIDDGVHDTITTIIGPYKVDIKNKRPTINISSTDFIFANDDTIETEEGVYNASTGIYYKYGTSSIANNDEYAILRGWTNGVVMKVNIIEPNTDQYIEITATLYKKSTGDVISGSTVTAQFPTNKSVTDAYSVLPKGGGTSVTMEGYLYWPASVFNTTEITEGLEDIEVRTTVNEYNDASKSTLIDSLTINKTKTNTISDLPVGSSIYINVDSTRTEFIIINQGNPDSSIYDASCDGTWILAKDCVTSMAWDANGDTEYANSDIKAYLDTYATKLDSIAKSAVQTVKIPYTNGAGDSGTLETLDNGISATAFLLSGTEVGFTSGRINAEGVKLAYFNSINDADAIRIASYSDSATVWWLRSPRTDDNCSMWGIDSAGERNSYYACNTYAIRPAFVLSSDTLVSDSGDIGLIGESFINEENTLEVDKFSPYINIEAYQNKWVESETVVVEFDDRFENKVYSTSGTGTGIKEAYVKVTNETTGAVMDEYTWSIENGEISTGTNYIIKDVVIDPPSAYGLSYFDNVGVYVKSIDNVGNTNELKIDNIKIDNAKISITTDIAPSDEWFSSQLTPIVTVSKPGGKPLTTIKIAETTSATAPDSSSNEWVTYSIDTLEFVYNTTEVGRITGMHYIHLIIDDGLHDTIKTTIGPYKVSLENKKPTINISSTDFTFANDDDAQTEEGVYNTSTGTYYKYETSDVAKNDKYVVLRGWTNGIVSKFNIVEPDTNRYVEITATLYNKSTGDMIPDSTVIAEFPTSKSSVDAYTTLPKGGGESVIMEGYLYWPASVLNSTVITEGLEDIEIKTTVSEYRDVSKSTLIDSFTTNKTKINTLSDLPVGSSVYMNVDGVRTEFIVVHQGNPNTAIYDEYCDGTWVLAKDCVTSMAWDTNGNTDYANSNIKAYLDTYITKLDAIAQSAIQTVELPYTNSAGETCTLITGNGISSAAFLLSGTEVGFISDVLNIEGTQLDYFTDSESRIANYNGSADYWWLRSPYTNSNNEVWVVSPSGSYYNSVAYNDYITVRPALILSSDAIVSDNGDIGYIGDCYGKENCFKADRFDANITSNAVQNTWLESATIAITSDDRVTGNKYSNAGTGSGIKEIYVEVKNETNGTIMNEYTWSVAVNATKVLNLDVGSSIYMNVDGVRTEFVVIHQGNPDATIYDPSCNGTWVLAKDCVTSMAWDANGDTEYANSDIKAYLDTYATKLDSIAKSAVQTIKLPYTDGPSSGGALATLENGISSTAFLLSANEVGAISSYANKEGSKLDYFNYGLESDNSRIANYNGSSNWWWLRSPYTDLVDEVWAINRYGDLSHSFTSDTMPVRPAFILNSDTLVSNDSWDIIESDSNTITESITDFTKDITIPSPSQYGVSYFDNISIYVKTKDNVGNTSEKTIDNIKIDNAETSITTDIKPSNEWFNTQRVPIVTVSKPGGQPFTTIKIAETTSATAPSTSSSEWKTYSPNVINFTCNTTEVGRTTGVHYIHLIVDDGLHNTITKTFGPYKVDLETPTAIISSSSGQWEKSPYVVVDASDKTNGSPLDYIEYKWKKSDGTVGGTEKIDLSSLSLYEYNDTYVIEIDDNTYESSISCDITIKDIAGNSFTTTISELKADKTVPVISVNPLPDSKWVNTAYSVITTVSGDSGAPTPISIVKIAETQSSTPPDLTSEDWKNVTISNGSAIYNNTTTGKSNGQHYIHVYVKKGSDTDANSSATTTTFGPYKTDFAKPSIVSFEVKASYVKHETTGWYWEKPTFELTVKDDGGSGIKEIKYSTTTEENTGNLIWVDLPTTSNSHNINFGNETDTFKVSLLDNAGNTNLLTPSTSIKVDTDNPVINLEPIVMGEQFANGEILGYVDVNISVNDATSGIKIAKYAITDSITPPALNKTGTTNATDLGRTGNGWIDFSAYAESGISFDLKAPGKSYIHIYVEDVAGRKYNSTHSSIATPDENGIHTHNEVINITPLNLTGLELVNEENKLIFKKDSIAVNTLNTTNIYAVKNLSSMANFKLHYVNYTTDFKEITIELIDVNTGDIIRSSKSTTRLEVGDTSVDNINPYTFTTWWVNSKTGQKLTSGVYEIKATLYVQSEEITSTSAYVMIKSNNLTEPLVSYGSYGNKIKYNVTFGKDYFYDTELTKNYPDFIKKFIEDLKTEFPTTYKVEETNKKGISEEKLFSSSLPFNTNGIYKFEADDLKKYATIIATTEDAFGNIERNSRLINFIGGEDDEYEGLTPEETEIKKEEAKESTENLNKNVVSPVFKVKNFRADNYIINGSEQNTNEFDGNPFSFIQS